MRRDHRGAGVVQHPDGSWLPAEAASDGEVTPLTDKYKDWEIFTIPHEEMKIGVGNCIPLGNKQIMITSGAPVTAAELERRGYTVIETPYASTPYASMYFGFGSGIHCSMTSLWRES